jgi:DNA (cytosine-5)-methyltransferase 1
MKILNLYAGIGGNRKLWGDTHEITAVEIEPKIGEIYHDYFPNDSLIITDAHKYLEEHFEEFDFIWSSPPCPTHSHIRKELAVEQRHQNKAVFPDMKLYEEILFLQGYFKGKFVVENVISWYKPLVQPREINKHYFWANFPIREIDKQSREHTASIKVLENRKGFNLDKYVGVDKRAILRNCVEPETGLHILNEAMNKTEIVGNQKNLF